MLSAIVFLPLIGFLIAGLFGKLLGHRPVEIITTSFVGLGAVLSWVLFIQTGFGHGEMAEAVEHSGLMSLMGTSGNGHAYERVQVLHWISSGDFTVDWAFRLDTLTAVMLVVVNSVSALVHLYSIGYMSHDEHRSRFFAYLSLFTFAMLMLVTSDNLLQMFFGWEGVGVASYLLIGFWYKKSSANAAAMKAFIVNRVGDFGYLLGIFGIFVLFGSAEFSVIFAEASDYADTTFMFLGMEVHALTTICLLLFMGAMGKSAQFLLHTWLPDAMEGPTPVSALIHAATMVTAGVFLVARMSPVFEYAPAALAFVTFIGGTTAIFAATVGLVQNDIKRVIAYSTCSQLGYMFVALGVGAYSVGIFHLFTHAFFKALLFLGAGSVIHAVSNEQDMRRMGGLWKKIPFTYAMMIIGTIALTGFPYTAGYFSKDAVIEAAFAGGDGIARYAFWMTVIAAALTSFYSWRLIFLTFHGKSRMSADVASHVHESPKVMTIPLALLAVGALLAGIVFEHSFVYEDGFHHFFREAIFMAETNDILHALHEVPQWVIRSPLVMMILGFLLAYWMYIRSPHLPGQLAAQHDIAYRFLLNKWYFDELYELIFIRPAQWLGRLFWKGGDGKIIDGFGPNGIAARVVDVTNRVVKLQTGFVYHYAFAMLIGVAALITYFVFAGGL
ncbi:MAG: NADH-quinone oxidoreductase subunit L [Devosiaceae bacterium]